MAISVVAEIKPVDTFVRVSSSSPMLKVNNNFVHTAKAKASKGNKPDHSTMAKAEEKTNSESKADELPTVSIAIAGSIIDNAQSLELATRLASQIARAATIFRIDEGMLPPLDAPHHLRKHEWAPYREGVTLKENATSSGGTLVDVGLDKNVVVNEALEPGIRVTVAMGTDNNLNSDLPRQVVSSSKPREAAGTYWGYKVRVGMIT
ncbi:hypothetical protein COLO4_06205 [Corchorus olitorius]|uniref:Uncharacterized protein n=1 Tax=Corchorus olitorius TaxID=93759 RepID=A0A1R3KNW8_9ROSI|nr:hypothetical protein COLO4_06205 [Corchorus olitorius]